jgi:tagatose 1,6-diphosphate aldolase
MTISEEKAKGIDALSDERGVIRAMAMDQRGSLRKALAKATEVSSEMITCQQMEEFKSAVVEVLSPYASAVLLDPEYGFEASWKRASGTGLLLAYEKSGYDNTDGARIPSLLPDWTVRRSIELGADCIKLLIYYTPLAENWANLLKKAFVERVGAECAHHEIPFFLELVGYDCQELTELEYARIKPLVVAVSMNEFSKETYKVDVLKVEIPVDLRFVSGTRAFRGGVSAYSLEEAREHYLQAAAATDKPFIYLSAGVSDSQFRESLEIAVDAGVNFAGVLCGRATWQDGIPVYAKHGLSALEDWLSGRGVQNIEALNKILEGAKPWRGVPKTEESHWIDRFVSAISMD